MSDNEAGATPEELRALFGTAGGTDAAVHTPVIAEPVAVNITAAMRRKLDEKPKADTSRQVSDLVRFALELGHADGEIQWLAPQSKAYQAWQAKDTKHRKAADDIDRMLAKFRPDHDHAGQACDVAGCANTPEWQSREPVEEARTWASYELTRQQLAELPPPDPIIENIFMRDTLVVLFGQPGAMKSFVALDWGMTIATGKGDWQGHASHTGPVYYVVSEGVRGVNQRVKAWEEVRSGDVGDAMLWRRCAVNLLNPGDVVEMVARMAEFQPLLIVIDTLARCMVGGDENSAQDMGLAIQVMDQIREAADGACVLVVHHATKVGEGYRGSSALAGAADTMIECTKSDSVVTLRCRKQKDAEEFEPLSLRVVPTLKSIVLELMEGRAADLPVNSARALSVFVDHFTHTGASKTETVNTFIEVAKVGRATAYRWVDELVARGLIENVGRGKVTRFVLTEAGREAAANAEGRLL